MPHVVFADAGHDSLGHQYLRAQSRGDGLGHVARAAPVVLHSQMLQVLLDGGYRDDAGFQFTRLHALAKFAPCVSAQDYFGGTHRVKTKGAPKVFTMSCHSESKSVRS